MKRERSVDLCPARVVGTGIDTYCGVVCVAGASSQQTFRVAGKLATEEQRPDLRDM